MTPVVRQVVIWLTALVTVAVMITAGSWQLGRADEKQQAAAALQARQKMAPWTNADWPCDPADKSPKLPVQRPVELTGHWLTDRTVFLDNRPMDGASGFIVVTPLQLTGDAGHCHGRVVLVQRGWVPRDQQDRTHLPELETAEDEVTVTGRVALTLSQVYQLGQEVPPEHQSGPVVRQNADVAFWSSWLGQSPLAGAVLQLQAAEPEDDEGLLRHWSEPGIGQERHTAYAVQWFAMAAVVIGLTIWFQLISPRRQRAT
jgi:surfeit locus 1 family protein